ncbi:MAG: hypothetical protein PHO37_06670 [Kiritimatiellae bacterium]|nr:hypothetical protein [Kiritimatiellia bacterium]
MFEMNDQEAGLLVAVQRGIPVAERPFAALAERCGTSESEVISFVQRLLDSGEARRFGAVFDSRRLGYCSALCCMRIPEEQIPTVAQHIVALRGVTHAYQRGWVDELPLESAGAPGEQEWPNFWFTLAAPANSFSRELDALRAKCAPYNIYELPALNRFKIDVVFDLRKGPRDEQMEARPAIDLNSAESYELTPAQQAIVRYLEGDLPVTADFYGQLANHLGLDKGALLETLTLWQKSGVMRRIGLLLRHRKVGFLANGMCCWNVPQAEIPEVGRRVSGCPEVTHCYERPMLESFPFNLFAMIHTTAWQDTQSLFQRIADDCGLSGGQLLLSVREYKKTSMQFF